MKKYQLLKVGLFIIFTLFIASTNLNYAQTVGSINGTCGGTGTIIGNPAGGTWSSSDPSVAPIDAVTGEWSLDLPGTAVFTYNTVCCGIMSTVNVTVQPSTGVQINAASATICEGDSLTIGASGADTYVWSNGLGTDSSIVVAPTVTTVYIVTGTSGTECSPIISDTITVNVTPAPVISVNNATICVGESTMITASGATSYAWSDGLGAGASQTVSPASTTTYTVVGTGASGCTNTASSIVTVNALPTVAANDGTVCAGSPATLTATGASTYSWSDGLGTSATVNPSPSVTTTYTVTGTDLNGCSNTASSTVTVNVLPMVSVNNATICDASAAALTATGANTYSWSNGLGTSSVVNPAPSVTTSYTVTGTDLNGCSDTASSTVTVNALPMVTANNATACEGSPVTLTATGASTYIWSDGLGSTATVMAAPATTTTYTVIGTSGQGCSDTTSATVTVNNLPTVTANDATICDGSPATLTAAGAVIYSWSDGLGTSSTVNASPSVTTTYTVTGTDLNGCSNTASSIVTVNALPMLAVNDATICDGSPATLIATGANTYSWSDGLGISATVNPSPSVTTSYLVTGTDLNGCSDTASSTVTVNALPTLSANDATICDGSPATLTAAGANTYSWSDGLGSTATVTTSPSATVTYTVTGTDLNGCSDTALSTVMVNPLPAVLVNDATICDGNSATLTGTGASTYSWSDGLGTTATVNPSPIVTTVYTVTGTDANGCSNSATSTVTVNTLPSVVANDATICDGSPATLTATGANTYLWSDGLGSTATVTASPSTTITYTVTGTSGQGCSDTALVTVTVNPLPIVAVNDATICEGDTAVLAATGATTYSWSNGLGSATTVSVTPVATAVFTVTGSTALGCSNSATATVHVNPAPVLSAAVSALDDSLCEGDTLVLQSNQTPGFMYSWSGPNGFVANSINPEINNVSSINAGHYVLTLIDSVTNCASIPSAFDSVFVEVTPAPVLGNVTASDQTPCEGDDITLNSQAIMNATYNWSGPNGFQSTLQHPFISAISMAGSGTYSVTVLDTLTGCSSIDAGDTVSINVIQAPDLDIPMTSSSNMPCEGDTLLLSASFPSGVGCQWTGPNGFTSTSSAPMIVNMSSQNAGDYYVFLYDSITGCSTAWDSTNVLSIGMAILPMLNMTDSILGCNGSDVTLDGGVHDSYVWSPGNQTSQTITVNQEGWYSLVVSNANNCPSESDSTYVSFDTQMAQATGDGAICPGDPFYFDVSNGVLYNWTGPNGYSSTDQNNTIVSATAPDAGEYIVIVEFSNGCTDSSSVWLQFSDIASCNLIPEIITPNGDLDNESFIIDFIKNYPDNNISILNRWGTEVYTAAPYTNQFNGTANRGLLIDKNELPNGTYFYLLDLGDGSDLIKGTLEIQR